MFSANKLLISALLGLVFGAFSVPSLAASAAPDSAKNVADSQKASIPRSNPFSILSDAEREYYAQSFSYAMETLKPDQNYEWRTATSNGIIRVSRKFTSPSRVECRTFTETFLLMGESGQMQGYGCKREGRDGWCKLKEGNMLSCAFEPSDNLLDNLELGAFDAAQSAKSKAHKAESGFWSWWPF